MRALLLALVNPAGPDARPTALAASALLSRRADSPVVGEIRRRVARLNGHCLLDESGGDSRRFGAEVNAREESWLR